MAGYRDTVASDSLTVLKKGPKTPSGYENTEEFLKEMRDRFDTARESNQHNEKAGLDDAKFIVGKQWDDKVEAKRIAARKPVLTVNRLIAFAAQIINNRLMNETEIRIFPDKSGTKEVAEIREGLIRSIYKNSKSDLARDEALKYQVIGGQGAFCLAVDYASDDVFDQEIKIKQIADPYSAVWDPLSVDPTGEDAEYAFVCDDIPCAEFKRRWKWAQETSFNSGNYQASSAAWLSGDTVRIVSYWRMVTEGTKTLALFQDGPVHDVSDMEEFEYAEFVAARPDGQPYVREVPNRFAQMYVCSGSDILEGPYNYPLSSIPVYRVAGWEVQDGDKLHRWGLVRFLKDPQRLHNYWRSVLAEQLIAAPRNKWLTTPGAVKGHEKRWRESPSNDDPFLYRNDGEESPVHVPPPPLDTALVTEAGMATQDIKDVSNIHEASLGMQSNEVSGRAIQARQTVSDVGSFIYHDRLRLADERCAKNINEWMPHIYDAQRVVTIIGQDNKAVLKMINDPSDPLSDITAGKYSVTVSVGPATVTKRALANDQMMAFVNAAPEAASMVMDLVAEAQDWPQSTEFARRFRMALPPGMIPQDEMTPEMQQAQAQQQEMQALQAQLAQKTQEAEIANTMAQAGQREAAANLAQAQAYKAIADAQARTADVESKVGERQTKQIMDALDQHNDMLHEDREFEADVVFKSAAARTAEKSKTQTGERGNGHSSTGK